MFSQIKNLRPPLKRCKLLIALISLCLCIIPLNASQFSPAIIVNSITISKYEVNERRKLLIALGTARASAKILAQENLINEALQKLHANGINITVGPAQLDEVFSSFLKIRNLTHPELKRNLAKFGASIEELKTYLKANVLMRNIVSITFNSRMTLDDFDLSLFRPAAATAIPTQVSLSEIIIPFSIRGKDNTIKLGERVQRDLVNGKDFEQLAKRFSRAGTSENGGLIGYIPITSIPNELRKILLSIKSGEISKTIITSNSIMIFKVNSWKNSEKAKKLPAEVSYLVKEKDDTSTDCGIKDNKKLVGPIRESSLKKSLREKLSLLRPSEEVVFINDEGLEMKLVLCDKRIILSDKEIKSLKGQLLEKRLSKLAEGLNLELKRTARITVLK
mgnify:CR=1 FL=1